MNIIACSNGIYMTVVIVRKSAKEACPTRRTSPFSAYLAIRDEYSVKTQRIGVLSCACINVRDRREGGSKIYAIFNS